MNLKSVGLVVGPLNHLAKVMVEIDIHDRDLTPCVTHFPVPVLTSRLDIYAIFVVETKGL